MCFHRQQEFAVLLIGGDVVRDAQHELLTRSVDIGIQQANGQPLLSEGGCQIGGDRRLANAAFSRGHSDHVVR